MGINAGCADEILLKKSIDITEFDDGTEQGSYLVRCNDRCWKVSAFVYVFLSALHDTPKLSSVQNYFQEHYHIALQEKQINDVLNFLTENNLLEGSEDTKQRKKSVLWMRITLLPAALVRKIRVFTPLFRRACIIPLSALCLAWMFFIFFMYPSGELAGQIQQLSPLYFLLAYLIILSITLIHELGHSSALLYHGGTPGRIGTAFYFFMPVLFSDVTDTWRLKRKSRFLVDYGGIYFQMIISMLIFAVNHLFLHNQIVTMAVCLSALQIISNLNPFIKMDGYWMLCDAIGSTNVTSLMFSVILNLFRREENRSPQVKALSKEKRIILLIYSVLFAAFITYFSLFIVKSFLLAVTTIRSDLHILLTASDTLTFSPQTVLQYLSSRFTKYIILIFSLRTVIGLIGKLAGGLKKRRTAHAA